jgi:uncharacterized protein (TIGR03089 family)
LSSPESLFADLLATKPAQPFVTYYDDGNGDRLELSARSLANWVAKTYGLLVDELGLGVGDRAAVALPAHWISVPVLLGCWSAGLTLVTQGPAEVAFVVPATIASAAGAPDVYVLAPESAARGFAGDSPPGTTDYVQAVRPQPDAWSGVRFLGAALDPAIDGLSRADVADRARTRASELELQPGARVLSSRVWRTAQDWLDTLLVPLALGGSLVLVANEAVEARPRRIIQERITAVIE